MKKKLILMLISILSMQYMFAGTPVGSYLVLKNASAPDITLYEKAIENADLENYRYQDKRCVLVFDSGVEIELLSAKELIASGQNINLGNYKYSDVPNWIQPTFHLNTDGTLTALYTKPNLKQGTYTK